MKTYCTVFEGEEALRQFIKKNNIIDSTQSLLQVFCGKSDRKHIQTLLTTVNKVFPLAHLIGSTSSRGITNEELPEQATVISISVFNTTEIKTHFETIEINRFEAGVKAAKAIKNCSANLAFVFCDGLKSDTETTLSGFNQVLPDLPVVGGCAGDEEHLDVTYVFDKKNISQSALVVAALSSPSLQVTRGYSLGWHAIGEEMTVTKASGNRIYEIEGESVKDIYTQNLGHKMADNMPYSCPGYPLLKRTKNGTTIARTINQMFDDGSALLNSNIETGDKVQIGFGSNKVVFSESKKDIKKLANTKPEAIFIYSCTTRLSFLQPTSAYAECKLLSKIAPIAGFFTYGNFYHDGDKTQVVDLALTYVGVRE